MSSADIVPIAIVLDEKSGYTLWAPPWEEDGEEWQAFLGAEDKILVFPNPAQLAQYVRDGDENDLSDHPAWDEVTELDPVDLVPSDDHTFDLDGIYDLAARAPDRWSVTELADALDMVARFAECCDDAIVEPLTDIPEIGMLDQGADVFVGRTGEKAWDRVGMTIASEWETVCSRLSEYLDWRDAGPLDEDLEQAQEEIDAAKRPIEDPDALLAAEAEVAEDEDEDDDDLEDDDDSEETDVVADESEEDDDDDLEDEDEDEDDEDEDEGDELEDEESDDDEDDTEDDEDDDDDDDDEVDDDEEPVAAPARVTRTPRTVLPPTGDDDEVIDEHDIRTDVAEAEAADPEAYAFWESVGILPVHLVLPAERFGFAEGFTLRCYLEDQPVFLGADESPWVFGTPDALLDVVEDPEDSGLDAAHDLAGLATWNDLVVGIRDDDEPVAVSEEDEADLVAVDEMVRGRQDPDGAVLARTADTLADLAEYGGLDAAAALLDGTGPLGVIVAAARDEKTIRIPVGSDAAGLVGEWEAVLDEVAGSFTWVE